MTSNKWTPELFLKMFQPLWIDKELPIELDFEYFCKRLNEYANLCVKEERKRIARLINNMQTLTKEEMKFISHSEEKKGGIIKNPDMGSVEAIIPLSMLGKLKKENPKFESGRLVCMRLCPDHKAVVTKVMIEGGIIKYECAWFHDGERKAAWFLAEELISGDEQTKIGFAGKD